MDFDPSGFRLGSLLAFEMLSCHPLEALSDTSAMCDGRKRQSRDSRSAMPESSTGGRSANLTMSDRLPNGLLHLYAKSP